MRPTVPLTALGDRTFGSLRRHRNYRLYFAGNGISFIGTWMQQIAAYWLVLELTGSALAVGALALVQTLPITVLALVGGAVADRVDLRRMVVSCETVLAAQAAVLCVLALTGSIQVWQLYVLGLVQGVALALDMPARHTLVFPIVGQRRPHERRRTDLQPRHHRADRRARARRAWSWPPPAPASRSG